MNEKEIKEYCIELIRYKIDRVLLPEIEGLRAEMKELAQILCNKGLGSQKNVDAFDETLQ